jgi:hypothetical protein
MTFENLGGVEDCSEAFILTQPPFGSSGLGDQHSPKPWPKSVFCFCPMSRQALFPSDLGALWVRRIDHLSDRSQSTPCYITRIGKIRRKVSTKPSEPFHSQENCAPVSIRISLEYLPVYR